MMRIRASLAEYRSSLCYYGLQTCHFAPTTLYLKICGTSLSIGGSYRYSQSMSVNLSTILSALDGPSARAPTIPLDHANTSVKRTAKHSWARAVTGNLVPALLPQFLLKLGPRALLSLAYTLPERVCNLMIVGNEIRCAPLALVEAGGPLRLALRR